MQYHRRLHSYAGLHAAAALVVSLAVLAAPFVLPVRASAQDQVEPAPPPYQLPAQPVDPLDSTPLAPAAGSSVFQEKNVTSTSNKSTFITEQDPSDVFNYDFLAVGWYRDPYSGRIYGASRSLIKFDLSAVPKGVKVYEAKIHLFLYSASPPNDSAMEIRYAAAKRSWDSGSATWYNAYDIGGDRHSLGSVGITQGWKDFNLTSQVQKWVDDPGSNHGLVLYGDEDSQRQRGRFFQSSRSGARPYLTVKYECDNLPPVTWFETTLNTYSPGKFNVRWTGYDQAPSNCTAAGIDKYVVEYSTDGGSTWLGWKDNPSTSADFDVSDPRTYVPHMTYVRYRIHAVDKVGNRENVNGSGKQQIGTTIVSQAPTAGMTPLPAETYTPGFTVSWNAINAPIGATGYDVQWNINGSGWTDLFFNTTLTSYTVANAKTETIYAFRVRARDQVGNVGTFPGVPQAQTHVILTPVASVQPFSSLLITGSSPISDSFTVNWRGWTPPNTTILQYQVHYQVKSLTLQTLQPWTIWQTFDPLVTSATFTIPANLGSGIYQFEATATNQNGTTPFKSNAEAYKVVDWEGFFKYWEFWPIIRHN